MYVTLNRIDRNGITMTPTSFRLDDLTIMPQHDRRDPGIRQVQTRHPFGTYQVRLEPGDTLTVLNEPDPDAARLAMT